MAKRQTYIKSVQLSGYRSIKNIFCEFQEGLNIIIGNNGSGKTNLLDFIDRILNRKYHGLNIFDAKIEIVLGENSYTTGELDGESEPIFNWETKGRISREIKDLETAGIAISEPSDVTSIYTEFIRFNLPSTIGILANELNSKFDLEVPYLLLDSGEENIPFGLAQWLRIASFDLDLKKTNDLNKASLYVLDFLSSSFDESFASLKKKLFAYTPLQDIRFSSSLRIVKVDASTMEFRNLIFEYKIEGEWFSWDTISDGTKRLIYTIFFINGIKNYPEGTNLFPITFIEEPEIGVHPHQLHLFLKYLQEKAKDQQILLTTHSPQVLDVLGAGELDKIVIAEIDLEKGTLLRHLDDKEVKKAHAYFEDKGLLSDYWRFSDFQRSKITK